MSDLVAAEVAAVEALQRGVTAYASSMQHVSSSIRTEAAQIGNEAREAVDAHRRRLRQAKDQLESAMEALRRCSDDARAACAQAVHAAQENVARARQRFDEARRAESRIAAAMQELARAAASADGVLGEQSAAARAALAELDEKLSAIIGSQRLTNADRAALRDITGLGHQQINRSLSAGSLEDVAIVAARTTAVSRALGKLPKHEGLVTRGSFGNLTEAQIAEYEPGEIRVEDRFIHSSVDPDVADGRFHGNVVWAIDSKTGRSVAAHSEVPSEREVMFDKFSRFEVLAKVRIDGTGQWLIYMREV